MALRPYQKDAEDQIFASWKDGYKNLMYQLVTGGGKTELFTDIIRKFLLAKKRAMLIAHREELIAQAWDKLYKKQIFSGIIKGDVKRNYSLPCQVASIQTIARRSELPKAHVVIIDEAHHSEYENTYGRALLDHFPNSYVLGVTATPYRLSGKGFTNLYEKLITGPTFKELVAWGYLTPLRLFIGDRPDLRLIKQSKGDYEIEEAAKAMALVPLVDSYLEHCAGMCGVVFACNVKHSNQVVSQYRDRGISAAHLDATTPAEERRQILQRFKAGQLKVISNVGIITEGFDFPDMEFVQLARPTKSLSMFLQMIGRVTRTDYNVIKDATDDDARRLLVSLSKKPFGYVLDNAGCIEEHGMPDKEHNWQMHFEGRQKKKKKPNEELIDLIEFVAEDEEGRQVRSRVPEEIKGMRLIEVNTIIREQIINLQSLKEFDRLLAMFTNMPKLYKEGKSGKAAYGQYKDYCRKNNFRMTAEVWDYIIKRLCDEPAEILEKAKTDRELNLSILKEQYATEGSPMYNPMEYNRMAATIDAKFAKAQLHVNAVRISRSWVEKDRAEYYKIILPASGVIMAADRK